MKSGRMAVADGNSRPSSKKLIRNFEPKKRIWAKAKAVIEAMRMLSSTVASAMNSELPSERNSVGPKMMSRKLAGSQLAGRPNGLMRSSPMLLKPPSTVV